MLIPKRLFLIASLACMTVCGCLAGPVYRVTLDTTAVAATEGAIYLQFVGGLNADPASVSITGFMIAGAGGLVGDPLVMGDVTGRLDAPPLMMGNTEALNDYLHFLTYGDWLRFFVEFNLPPVLVGDSGSAFLFGLTGPDGFSPILTEDPGGFMGQIAYDYEGIFSTEVWSQQADIYIPEPASWLLAVVALCALAWARLRRRRI